MAESFYLTRLKDVLSQRHNYLQTQVGHKETSRSVGFGKWTWLDTGAIVETMSFDYQEETYKGFQLIVGTIVQKVTKVYDLNGESLYSLNYDSIVANPQDYKYEEPYELNQSWAYAWRIGTQFDSVTNLNWGTQFSTIAGTCVTNSTAKTIKLAKAKLDIESQLFDNLAVINAINDDRMNYNERETPYNLKVGDKVFIHAFSRHRRGLVIGTTGRRFIVGYSTPTSPEEPKYKVLNLNHIYVKHGEVIQGQEHNWVQVTP